MVQEIGRQIEQSEALADLISKKTQLLKSLLEVESSIASMCLAKNHSLEQQVAVIKSEPVSVSTENLSGEVRKRGRKPKGELSLSNLILQLVSSSEGGMTMSEIATQLFQNGFKTESAEPARLISATLSTMKCKGLLHKNEANRFVVSL